MKNRLILDLCGGTGAWSAPYRAAGYDVHLVDIQKGQDVRLLTAMEEPVHGILAAPPCTQFASSGARWWANKGEDVLLDALTVVDACLRAVVIYKPVWWALENPVGRLRRYLGDPALIFDPCDYGDPYTKKTLVWGQFNIPDRKPVAPVEGSKVLRLPPSPERKTIRSITPGGFAREFFVANP